MKKIVIILLSIFWFAGMYAQRDSLKRIRLSGFQLDIGPHNYPQFSQMDQADYQEIVKSDPFLNADLSSYKKEQWYTYRTFNGLAGFKLFAEINDSKKIKKEIYIGLKYGEEAGTGIYYTRENYDTIGVYTESNSNKKIYNIAKNSRSYSYGINSRKLILPVGFNFTSDKSRLFWITYGVEIAPAFNFAYVLNTSYSENASDVFVKEGDTLKSGNNYVLNNSQFVSYSGNSNKTRLPGTGFGFSASLPFCVYLHPSRKIAFLKHINLMASVMPTYMYSHTKYSGSGSLATIALATGIRYNW